MDKRNSGEGSHLLRILGGQGSESSFRWQACVLASAPPPRGCVCRVPLCVLLPLCCHAAASQEPSDGACVPQANWNLDHSVLHGGALLPLPLGRWPPSPLTCAGCNHTKPLAVFDVACSLTHLCPLSLFPSCPCPAASACTFLWHSLETSCSWKLSWFPPPAPLGKAGQCLCWGALFCTSAWDT